MSDWRAYDFVYDVYVMNADGSNIRPLIEGPFAWPDNRFYFQPSWSPDGQKIAVVVCVYAWENCYPRSSIAITNADGTGLTTLVEAGGYARPTWSPDGSTIAFGSRTCSGCVSSLRYTRVDGSASGLIFSNGHSPACEAVIKVTEARTKRCSNPGRPLAVRAIHRPERYGSLAPY